MPQVWTDNRAVSAQEMSRLSAAIAGTYVFPTASGGAVTTNSNMAPTIAAIIANTSLHVNGTLDTTGYAGGTVTVSTADVTNPRRDWIYYDGAGGVGVTAGTPAAVPVLPNLTAGRIGIYEVYVAAGDTSIDAGDLIDRRANVAFTTVSDGIRTQFRANRRLRALWSAQAGAGSVDAYEGQGVGFTLVSITTAATALVVNVSGEGYTDLGLVGVTMVASGNAASPLAQVAPNHSPRMLCRVKLPAASANVTYVICGFFDTSGAAASAGAFLRVVTTGNVEFVTDQGGTETATSLGVLSRTTILGFEIETPDAGVTWYCRNQAGTVLATHTTNVPTATTALAYGYRSSIATGAVASGPAYMEVWTTDA